MQEYSEVDSVSSGFSSNVVGKTSILECLRNHLRKKTENILKMSLSDHDAFSWKLRREKMPLLDTIQLINVNRTMKDCEQVELGQLQEISFPVLSYTTT